MIDEIRSDQKINGPLPLFNSTGFLWIVIWANKPSLFFGYFDNIQAVILVYN